MDKKIKIPYDKLRMSADGKEYVLLSDLLIILNKQLTNDEKLLVSRDILEV